MKTILSIALSLILIAGTLAPMAVHAAEPPVAPNAKKTFTITGAGATFPFPLIDTWRVEYNKVYPNVQLNYQSIGSGGGVKQHTEKTVSFGATDAPLTKKEAAKAAGTLTIPEAIGSITVSYNIPEIPQSGLKLTGEVIANIYLGTIKKWNDPRITELNPDLELPNKSILVARRSDGSGTTYAFTDYLSKVSGDWQRRVGVGKSVPWPVGVGAAGNEGVAFAVKNSPYAIGYVELAYAFQNGMTYAYVQNADKTAFIEPTLETIAAAAAGAAPKLPKAEGNWEPVSISNAPGANSYPIASFTYLLVYEDLSKVAKDKDQAQAIVHLIHWMITEGQKFSSDLLYVPLSEPVKEIGKQGLARVNYNGEKLWNYESVAMPSAEKSMTDKTSDKMADKMTDKKTTEKDTKKKTTEKDTKKKTTAKKTTVKKTNVKPTTSSK
ncbi:MAG: phosphate ABC transporter substrate-binding protein PstS [Nitrososphaerota archaeon]|nr:phosphate ABC transporter substrate-binding protein PstS [Nitrososphaerota archaeon]